MIKISLKDFVLKGDFGPIKVGMHRDEVVDILGEPGGAQDFGTGYSGLIYGWYEFFYYTDTKKLSSMQNDHLQADCSNHKECIFYKNNSFETDIWFLEAERDFTYSEVKEILSKEKIPYLEVDKTDFIELKFESEVTMGFEHFVESANHEDPVLNGIRYFPELG